jgi:hypothetical protein
MEDILISELPLFEGDVTGAYILINDSSETETYKVLREHLFSGAPQTQFSDVTVTNLTFSANSSVQTHSSDFLLTSYLPDGDTVDLTKQVLSMRAGTWTLPDGVEGQIMYFVLATDGTASGCFLTVSHLRYEGVEIDGGTWSPFQNGSGEPIFSVCTAIFTNDYWVFSGGWLIV